MRILLLLLALAGCGQDYNSNSGDKTSSDVPEAPADASDSDKRRLAAVAILKQNCFSCHTWSGFSTDKLWVDAGLVIAGNADGSELMTRLINNGGDMPEGGSALATSDVKILTDWINGIK